MGALGSLKTFEESEDLMWSQESAILLNFKDIPGRRRWELALLFAFVRQVKVFFQEGRGDLVVTRVQSVPVFSPSTARLARDRWMERLSEIENLGLEADERELLQRAIQQIVPYCS